MWESQVAQMDLSVETEKGRVPDINCSYPAKTDNVWPHYFIHLLLRYTVHESTWKYTYVTQFCPQPFTFAFNLCGVFAVCFTHHGPCQKKRGPSAWAWHFSSLPLARPAIFAHTCACNFPRCLSALSPTWDALRSHLPMNPGVPSPTLPRLATDDCIFDVQRGSAPIYHLLMWHLTFITRVLEHATAIENELH